MTKYPMMECACCGQYAGKWEQFWNQDYEYAVCTSCAIWIAGREGWDYVFGTYGVPGRNWRPPTEDMFTKEHKTCMRDFKAVYLERYDREFEGKTIHDKKEAKV